MAPINFSLMGVTGVATPAPSRSISTQFLSPIAGELQVTPGTPARTQIANFAAEGEAAYLKWLGGDWRALPSPKGTPEVSSGGDVSVGDTLQRFGCIVDPKNQFASSGEINSSSNTFVEIVVVDQDDQLRLAHKRQFPTAT